jgi:chloramphenicol 3-O-phosphotransferase
MRQAHAETEADHWTNLYRDSFWGRVVPELIQVATGYFPVSTAARLFRKNSNSLVPSFR